MAVSACLLCAITSCTDDWPVRKALNRCSSVGRVHAPRLPRLCTCRPHAAHDAGSGAPRNARYILPGLRRRRNGCACRATAGAATPSLGDPRVRRHSRCRKLCTGHLLCAVVDVMVEQNDVVARCGGWDPSSPGHGGRLRSRRLISGGYRGCCSRAYVLGAALPRSGSSRALHFNQSQEHER